MQGSVQFDFVEISPVEKRLNVEVAREQVASKLDEAYRKLSREVNLRGFRKGKAPRALLERLFGKKVTNDVTNQLINESLNYVSQHDQTRWIGQPALESVEDLKQGQPLRWSARLELLPRVEPKDYEGVEVTRRRPGVPDEQLADALERRRREHAEMLPIEGRDTAGPKDTLAITLSGEIGPARYPAKDISVDLSEPQLAPVPGLAEALIGVSLSAKDHEVRLTMPQEGIQPDLAGKEGVFKVTVRDGHEKQLPDLDDDFARDTGEADTLDQLREKIREKLLEEDRKEAEQEARDLVLEEVLRRNPVPLPPSLVKDASEHYMQGLYRQVQRGQIPGNLDINTLRETAHANAVRGLQVEFVLESIATKEKIELTEAELEKHLSEAARQQDKSVARLKAELQKDDPGLQHLRRQMRLDKTVDLLESRAKIKEAEE